MGKPPIHGYSGKPLAQKLGLTPAMSAACLHAPAQYGDLLGQTPPPSLNAGPYEFVHAFARTRAELDDALARILPLMAPGGMVWISWPKKTSSLHQDLTEDGVREAVLPLGWVDVKVCAVDADWSGLKLLRRRK